MLFLFNSFNLKIEIYVWEQVSNDFFLPWAALVYVSKLRVGCHSTIFLGAHWAIHRTLLHPPHPSTRTRMSMSQRWWSVVIRWSPWQLSTNGGPFGPHLLLCARLWPELQQAFNNLMGDKEATSKWLQPLLTFFQTKALQHLTILCCFEQHVPFLCTGHCARCNDRHSLHVWCACLSVFGLWSGHAL